MVNEVSAPDRGSKYFSLELGLVRGLGKHCQVRSLFHDVTAILNLCSGTSVFSLVLGPVTAHQLC